MVGRDLVVRGGSVQEMCPGIVGQQVGRSTSRSALEGGQRSSSSSSSAAQRGKKKKRVLLFGPTLQTLRPQVLIPDLELATAGQRPDRGQCVLTPDPTQGFRPRDIVYFAGDQNVTAAVVTCDSGWVLSPH